MGRQILGLSQHSVLFCTIRSEIAWQWLQTRLGADHEWDLDLPRGAFRYVSPSGEVRARAQLLASIALSPATLVWGWSPQAAGWAGPHPDVERLRSLAQSRGLTELTTEEIPYPGDPSRQNQAEAIADFSHQVGAAAINQLGPDFTYYSAPSGDAGAHIVVLLDRWSEQPPAPSAPDVVSRLPRLLPGCLDPGWSLDGLAQLMPGWKLEDLPAASGAHGEQGWRLRAGTEGAFDVVVARDAQQRIVDVRVSGPVGR